MSPCLLCPSPAVADELCVPCGAKLWAAENIIAMLDNGGLPDKPDPSREPERAAAMAHFGGAADLADDFLARIEAAKVARLRKEGACPECERITPRDPHKENCSKGII